MADVANVAATQVAAAIPPAPEAFVRTVNVVQAAASSATRRIAPVVKPAVAAVHGVSGTIRAIAATAGATLHALPASAPAVRGPHSVIPVPHPSRRAAPATTTHITVAENLALGVAPSAVEGPRAAHSAPRWVVALLGTNIGSNGAPAGSSGGASGPPAALQALPGVLAPFMLQRFATSLQTPHSPALLLTLERPG